MLRGRRPGRNSFGAHAIPFGLFVFFMLLTPFRRARSFRAPHSQRLLTIIYALTIGSTTPETMPSPSSRRAA